MNYDLGGIAARLEPARWHRWNLGAFARTNLYSHSGARWPRGGAWRPDSKRLQSLQDQCFFEFGWLTGEPFRSRVHAEVRTALTKGT
jgi:hypothetical protein